MSICPFQGTGSLNMKVSWGRKKGKKPKKIQPPPPAEQLTTKQNQPTNQY